MAPTENLKRGRPKQTANDIQNIRNTILSATRTVFGQYGSKGLTVERIIQAAEISRPTFYKYFSKAEAPLDLIIESSNATLIKEILTAATNEQQAEARMQAAIDTYLDWGRREIDILGAIQQELLTPETIVAKHRLNTLDSMYDLLQKTLKQEGRPTPDRVVFDSLLLAAENIGYHLLLNSNPERTEQYRIQMLKLAIALFGNKKDWQVAAANQVLFDDL